MERGPRIEDRPAQPYIAVHEQVADEAQFRGAADAGFPELFEWARDNGIAPTGPPFIRYLALDPEDHPIEIELAAPINAGASGDGRIRVGTLPAGSYATLLHVGPYASAEVPDLISARVELLGWAERRGIEVARSRTAAGTTFEACVERYVVDPIAEPDWSKWETELAYLLRDG